MKVLNITDLFPSSKESSYSWSEGQRHFVVFLREKHISGCNETFGNGVLLFFTKVWQHSFLMKKRSTSYKQIFSVKDIAIRKYKKGKKKAPTNWTITDIIRKSIKSNLLLRQQVYLNIVTNCQIITKKFQLGSLQ